VKTPYLRRGIGQILLIKFLALGPITGGVCCYFPLIKVLKIIFGKIYRRIIDDRGAYGTHPGVCLSGPKIPQARIEAGPKHVGWG
jgi:hypothetical protein